MKTEMRAQEKTQDVETKTIKPEVIEKKNITFEHQGVN
jgi:hypothetical protein